MPVSVYAEDAGNSDPTFCNENTVIYVSCFPESGAAVCSASATADVSGTGTNKDYKGGPILNDAQLKAVGENQSTYETAATEQKIPWQLIAAIHLRETGLKRYNPSNGNGPYQILGTNYPASDLIDDATFLKQTKEAAAFIKARSSNPDLLSKGDEGEVKDIFFSYNGRAEAYTEQAKRLGFSEGYEGSPYVMNIADAKRDPATNPTGWGQITTDGGSLTYPANNDHGAFIAYAAMSGLSLSGDCSSTVSGPTAQKVVTLAEQELKLWLSGKMKPGTDFHKYSQGRTEAWCADFVSWLYNQAGYPLREGNEGNVAAVDDVKQIGLDGTKFEWHAAGGYTPKPGDIQVQQGGDVSHVSLVVAVDGDSITKIGGNQSGSGGPTTTKVSKDNWMPSTIGYVSPKG